MFRSLKKKASNAWRSSKNLESDGPENNGNEDALPVRTTTRNNEPVKKMPRRESQSVYYNNMSAKFGSRKNPLPAHRHQEGPPLSTWTPEVQKPPRTPPQDSKTPYSLRDQPRGIIPGQRSIETVRLELQMIRAQLDATSPSVERDRATQDEVDASTSSGAVESLSDPKETPATQEDHVKPQEEQSTTNGQDKQDDNSEQDNKDDDDEQHKGLRAPTYVPYVEATPLMTNMFATTTSHYGRVNADIMGGFGGDDDSIWLVDDEETDDEVVKDKRNETPGEQIQETTETQAQHKSSIELEDDTIPEARAKAVDDANRPWWESNARKDLWKGLDDQTTDGSLGERRAAHLRAAHLMDSESLKELERATEDKPTTERPASVTHSLTAVESGLTSAASRPTFRYRELPELLDGHEWVQKSKVQSEEPPATTKFAYAPINRSILADFGDETLDGEGSTQITEKLAAGVKAVAEQRLESSREELAGTLSDLGQRYKMDTGVQKVTIEPKRVVADRAARQDTCRICAEDMTWEIKPTCSPTRLCKHTPGTCDQCLQTSIRVQLESKLWTEISCPECSIKLEYSDVELFADKCTLLRYESICLRAAMSQAKDFIWCPSGCGSGQIHDAGPAQPVVQCLHCQHRFCFSHEVAWHDMLTCAEYDDVLADPDSFRLPVAARYLDIAGALRTEAEAAAGRRPDLEEKRKAADVARKVVARMRMEARKTQDVLNKTTKPCPGCGSPIEKSDGCSHMTCIKCRHEFCWNCQTKWTAKHSINCGRAGGE